MSSTIDQQFIEYVVKSLVGNPDAVKVERRIDEKGVLLELSVDPEDLGRVIGKRGATAQSLRTLLRALGTKNDARYNLKIVDNGEGPTRRDRDDYERPARDDEPDAEKDEAAKDVSQEVEAEPVQEEQEQSDEVDQTEDDHDDLMAKHRKDLEDLDDLDV